MQFPHLFTNHGHPSSRIQWHNRVALSILLLLSLVRCYADAHLAVIYPQHDGIPPESDLLAHMIMPPTLSIPPLALTVAPWTQNGSSDDGQDSPEEVQDININVKADVVVVNSSSLETVDLASRVAFLSCDIASNDSSTSSPAALLHSVLERKPEAILLYTTVGNWCWMEGPPPSGRDNIFTMLNASDAQRAMEFIHTGSGHQDGVQCMINGSIAPPPSAKKSEDDQSPTLIVVASVGGSFSGFLCLLIIIGVVRACLYPERYGPRDSHDGQSPVSRTQGVTRAILDTFPVIWFRNEQHPDQNTPGDIEMQSKEEVSSKSVHSPTALPGEMQHLACSICTEDFAIPQNVRILPCNHAFHPACIDPWLLTRSSKCPLCRLNLMSTPESDANNGCDGQDTSDDPSPAAQGEHSHGQEQMSWLRLIATYS